MVSCWILFRIRNISDKICRENKNTFLYSVTFYRKWYRSLNNAEKYGRDRQATDGNITQHMRIACWVSEATNTHSDYAIPVAFSLHQWLYERTSILRLYVHCLSCSIVQDPALRHVQWEWQQSNLRYLHLLSPLWIDE